MSSRRWVEFVDRSVCRHRVAGHGPDWRDALASASNASRARLASLPPGQPPGLPPPTTPPPATPTGTGESAGVNTFGTPPSPAPQSTLCTVASIASSKPRWCHGRCKRLQAFARRQLQSTDKSLAEDLVQAVFAVLTGQGIECNVTDLTYCTVGDTTTVCYKTKGDEDADDAYDIESSASFPALLANAMSELGRSGSEYSVEATYLTTEALVNDPPPLRSGHLLCFRRLFRHHRRHKCRHPPVLPHSLRRTYAHH